MSIKNQQIIQDCFCKISSKGKIIEFLSPLPESLLTEGKFLFLSEIFEENNRQDFLQLIDKSVNQKVVCSGTFQAKNIQGKKLPMLAVNILPVAIAEKPYLIVHLKEITDNLSQKTKIADSYAVVNAIINTAVDGIITINNRGIIETINPAACKMFEYEANEVIGKNVSMLMPEPDRNRHDSYLSNYQNTGEAKIIGIGREVSGIKKNGKIFPLNLGVSEVTLSDRKFYTGLLHDLTDQKLYEEKLRRIAKELKRSNSELEDFAYVSSHDLQEPLRKIQTFGDRIKQKEANNLSEQGLDYLERMLNASARMQNLINDLLTFSRVTSMGKSFSEVNLNQVINEVLSDLEIAIEQSKAKVIVEKLANIEADSTQLRQLFQNLISNAIKFQPPNQIPEIHISGKLIQRKEHLIGTPGDQLIEIIVRDNGIGFSQEYADKIFNIFQRLEGKRYHGSGIGLSICKKITNRHGGDIKVESKVSEGSSFIITLATKQT